jgi:hypothetical protein
VLCDGHWHVAELNVRIADVTDTSKGWEPACHVIDYRAHDWSVLRRSQVCKFSVSRTLSYVIGAQSVSVQTQVSTKMIFAFITDDIRTRVCYDVCSIVTTTAVARHVN